MRNYEMSDTLKAKVLDRLAAYDFKKEKDGWLKGGRCPNCNKKELTSNYWILRCNRQEQCQYQEHIKNLFHDIFSDWSERANDKQKHLPKEKQNPNEAADLYLKEGRGFDLEIIKGWYTQEHYYSKELEQGSATVRFPLVNDGHWERIIDRPERFGGNKARFAYQKSYQGYWWQPPTLNFTEKAELWIVEGIFDAIAHLHNNIAAVSIMSAYNYPGEALKQLEEVLKAEGISKDDYTLVWALDRGNVGEEHLKKYYKQARAEGWNCEAALPPPGKQDWNDLHQFGKLQADDLEKYKYYGALLVAERPKLKARLIYNHGKEGSSFHFDFNKTLWWAELKAEELEKAKTALRKEGELSADEIEEEAIDKALKVQCLAECYPVALYSQLNEIIDQRLFYFRLDFPFGEPSAKNTFNSSQLSSAAEFKKRLLEVGRGVVYKGSAFMLDTMLEKQFRYLKEVNTIDYTGYSKEYQAYILGKIAFKNGVMVEMNKEDFFNLPGGVFLKSLQKNNLLNINTNKDDYTEEWIEHLWNAFGVKGFIALAFWLATLFAEQIRAMHGSLFFMEIVGEPNAGKTDLLKFLWKLFGRANYEGIDPSKGSQSGRARSMAQTSNMPIVFIESDRENTSEAKNTHVRGFDWDECKTFFNGGTLMSRGVKNQGNETYEPPFRGALAISQNNPVKASEAIMTRICQDFLYRTLVTEKSTKAFEFLKTVGMDKVSYFIVKALQKESQILEILKNNTSKYEREILSYGDVQISRIALNHAQLMAAVDALAELITIPVTRINEMKAKIVEMAAERQSICESESQALQDFWDMYSYLQSTSYKVNHLHADDTHIAINLNHFVAVAKAANQTPPNIRDLKRELKASKSFKFIELKNVGSILNNHKTAYCWVFKK